VCVCVCVCVCVYYHYYFVETQHRKTENAGSLRFEFLGKQTLKGLQTNLKS
jgi:hypothetical protein